jgi:hypothetical protein
MSKEEFDLEIEELSLTDFILLADEFPFNAIIKEKGLPLIDVYNSVIRNKDNG